MSIPELHEFFVKLVQREQLPTFLCGLFLGLSLVPLVLRLVKRWLFAELDAQIKELKDEKRDALEKVDRLTSEAEGLDRQKAELEAENGSQEERIALLEAEAERLAAVRVEKIDQLSKACEDAIARIEEGRLKLNKDRRVRRNLQRMVNSYINQLDDITNSDGKIWEKKANGQVVPFIPLSMRRTAIISLLNLKGGVGKTTLTANLGAALAAQGLRVLLVDLDHQSSLTKFCLSVEERKGVSESNRYIDNFFEECGDFERLRLCVTRHHGSTSPGQIHVAAVTEEFNDLENRLQARWAVGLTTDDVRYRLRKGLHSPWLREHYDVVLIDCPPRWSTGSINAVFSSDYVLIPVLLEEMSTTAVPRILNWLKKFQSNCFPELDLLGVVGNKAKNHDSLIGREKTTWIELQEFCRGAWNGPVRFFDEVMRDHSSSPGHFASLSPGHRSRYEKLVDLIRKEIPHAHLHPSAIHPPVGAPLGGGRS